MTIVLRMIASSSGAIVADELCGLHGLQQFRSTDKDECSSVSVKAT